MTERLILPAKKIGLPLMDGYCERCHYIQLHMVGPFPFAPFPSIFSTIDAITKDVFTSCFEAGDLFPALSCLGNLTGSIDPPSHRKFRIDLGDDLAAWGSPDAIFVRDDGKLVIGDFKTAMARGESDPLYPLYQVQVSTYRYIAEKLGWDPVEKLALIYTEPQRPRLADEFAACKTKEGFHLNLRVKVHEVPTLSNSEIEALMKTARAIYDQPFCPKRRTGCRSCDQVDQLLEIVVPQMEQGVSVLFKDSVEYEIVMAASRIGAYGRMFRAG